MTATLPAVIIILSGLLISAVLSKYFDKKFSASTASFSFSMDNDEFEDGFGLNSAEDNYYAILNVNKEVSVS